MVIMKFYDFLVCRKKFLKYHNLLAKKKLHIFVVYFYEINIFFQIELIRCRILLTFMILLGIFLSYYQNQFTFNINKTKGEMKKFLLFL